MRKFESFETEVIEALEEHYGSILKCNIKNISKNNGVTLRGVTCDFGQNIAPTVYLTDLYKEYEHGKPVSDIIEQVIEMLDEAKCEEDVDISFLKSYDSMKDRLLIKLVNTERNREFLKTVPHKEIMDLSAIFYTRIADNAFGTGTITIQNVYFEDWHVSIDTMYADALENTKNILKDSIRPIEEVMIELFMENNPMNAKAFIDMLEETPCGLPMFVMTNKDKIFGASCILNTESLERFANEKNSNLLILPCSIHELIILPESSGVEPEAMKGIVGEINGTEISPSDFLSDSIYRFSRSRGLEIVS